MIFWLMILWGAAADADEGHSRLSRQTPVAQMPFTSELPLSQMAI
jgi:hypothetical protein